MAKSKAQCDDQGLPPSELARAYKRDRKASAGERAGMNTGAAKQFKTVADTIARRGQAAAALLAARRVPKGPSDR
jgi:hypothetical protein